MSLCQTEKASCGACCGILNLDLEKLELNSLLMERTEEFEKSVDFKKSWTIADYRKVRESIEDKIQRVSPEIYVCPFLGYINKTNIGCMIHPNISGNPLSQNFSFYGAGICQGYDCKNKERTNIFKFQKFIVENLKPDNFIYMNIVSDHILISYIINFFESRNIFELTFLESHKDLVLELLLRKFSKKEKLHTTSFEFDMENGDVLTKLIQYLFIQNDEEIFFKLERV